MSQEQVAFVALFSPVLSAWPCPKRPAKSQFRHELVSFTFRMRPP